MYNDPKGIAGSHKTPLALIPPVAMEQTALVLKLGATKYGAFNWRKTGVCASTYLSAMMRHLNAWRDGEDLDPESGITHLAHVAANCNILMDAAACDTLQDDRYRKPCPKQPPTECPLPDTGYRVLDDDEPIQEGDEYFSLSGNCWCATQVIHTRLPKTPRQMGFKYRRKEAPKKKYKEIIDYPQAEE